MKEIEDMTIDEMKEIAHQIMTTPPGTCWKCGANFFTISPRTQCAKCLGMGVEPFSLKGFVYIFLICVALVVPFLFIK